MMKTRKLKPKTLCVALVGIDVTSFYRETHIIWPRSYASKFDQKNFSHMGWQVIMNSNAYIFCPMSLLETLLRRVQLRLTQL